MRLLKGAREGLPRPGPRSRSWECWLGCWPSGDWARLRPPRRPAGPGSRSWASEDPLEMNTVAVTVAGKAPVTRPAW
jgi:hypothetical protein